MTGTKISPALQSLDFLSNCKLFHWTMEKWKKTQLTMRAFLPSCFFFFVNFRRSEHSSEVQQVPKTQDARGA